MRMSTVERIREHLAALRPDAVEVIDDSAAHAGHAGAQSGGGHYHVTVVSSEFAGKPMLARHRMVYAALADMMQRDIHALAIDARTPDQI
jgi:BolA family transcriptional regulator, general stress-responsive regulator